MISRYQDLYPLMADELTGCQQDRIMLQALQWAGRRFCMDTEAWIEEIAAIDIVADQETYDLADNILWDAHILRFIWVKVDGTTADPADTDDYYLEEDCTLHFQDDAIPSAAVTDGLVIKAAFCPYLFSIEIAEWFMEKWSEALVGGAMNRLMSQFGKPWYNKDRAREYLLDYKTGVNRAKAEIARTGRDVDDYVEG